MQFKSKSVIESERKSFTPLVADDYELIVVKVEPGQQAKFNATPDETGKIPMENIINIQLEVVAFKDGDPAVDMAGAPAHGRKLFFTCRPESMGFLKDGSPSKSRALVAYATGQSVEDDLNLGSWNDLIGKTVYAEVIAHTSQKGNKGNKIARFLPKRARPKVQTNDENIPVIEDSGTEDIQVDQIPF